MKKWIPGITLVLITCVGSVFAQISFSEKTSFAGLGGSALNQGLALGDYDLDGREDLYVTAVGGGPNRLYRNMGNFIFQDVSAQAGVAYSGSSKVSSWGDIDNDGDPDLYVGNRDEADILYINQGDGTFQNKTVERGIANPANTTSVSMADFNNDGWLDIYVSNIQSPNLLYMNDGTGHFTNYATDAGVDDLAIGMGAVIFDYDLDGDVDIYQCHDAQTPYILYENQGNGLFEDVSAEAKVNYAGFGMGVDAGDFNRDGYLDLYITNLYDNVLYQNMGDGTFESVGEAMQVNDPGMGWGCVFADFDNDRQNDIYASNDTYFSPYTNVLYHNTGNTFEIASDGEPCESPYGSYATVASDLNDDGLMDILVANSGAPGVQLFQNTTSGENHYIGLRLEGVQSNRDAIGARLEVYTNAGVQYDQVIGNSGFSAHNGRWIHFGLADQNSVEKIIIQWPSGLVEQINNLDADQKYRIREGEGLVTAASFHRPAIKPCSVVNTGQGLDVYTPYASRTLSAVMYDMTGRNVPVLVSLGFDAIHITTPHPVSGLYQIVVRQPDGVCVSKQFLTSH